MAYYNYARQPNIQGYGFYNPYMKGPDYGQGMRETINNVWSAILYNQEQQKLRQKEDEEKRRWEKDFKLTQEKMRETQRHNIAVEQKEKTTPEWQYRSRLADQWYKQGLLSNDEYKHFKLTGKLPQSLEAKIKETAAITETQEKIRSKYKAPKETKPPISQASLLTKLRQRTRDVIRRQIQKAGGDISTLTGDTPMEVLMALMQKQAGGTSTAASKIAQKVDNMTGQFEILLSDREMTQEEKRGVQKYLQFISQIDKYEPQIEAMLKIPGTTIEEVIQYFMERVIK